MLSTYKVVVVGASGVGKTAIVQRLVDGSFTDEGQPTIGVEFKCYTTRVGDDKVKLNIWDTAGQEKFRSVSKAYFRNAVGAILVYALNDRNSFDELGRWLNDLQSLSTPNCVILAVGNKLDLEEERVIPSSEAEAFAERHGLEYFEMSALDARNVEGTFAELTKKIHEKVKKGEIKGNFQLNSPPIVVSAENRGVNNNSSGCC
ncbi:hypothetical protein M9Y10_011254 [Tritrichomonas musculus]|uniref:Uncharacterized protein n=1 Tax=Tritrichomonas musculus TaxID=1915356 RepID=A0ABR2IJ00_9EUKA